MAQLAHIGLWALCDLKLGKYWQAQTPTSQKHHELNPNTWNEFLEKKNICLELPYQ